MNCPLCLDTVLEVTFHAGVELDICPRCRGVWLDRGELERIASDAPHSRSEAAWADDGRREPDWRDRDDRDWSDRRDDGRSEKRRKRKKSLASRLGEALEEVIDL